MLFTEFNRVWIPKLKCQHLYLAKVAKINSSQK
jgi:hypothetical protein